MIEYGHESDRLAYWHASLSRQLTLLPTIRSSFHHPNMLSYIDLFLVSNLVTLSYGTTTPIELPTITGLSSYDGVVLPNYVATN